jgi:hypothetical protein
MKYLSLGLLLLLLSCAKKEAVLLPKSDVTMFSNVEDHSPIYIFFRANAKDTLVEVNRNNSIVSTNWILNIDKRLPLGVVVPEVIKLQEKKRNAVAHKNEAAQNYYSYADSIHKNMAFLLFTEVYYKLEKPKSGVVVYFDKNNEITVNNVAVKRNDLKRYLADFPIDYSDKFLFCFSKHMNYGNYIQNEIFVQSLKMTANKKEEFVY